MVSLVRTDCRAGSAHATIVSAISLVRRSGPSWCLFAWLPCAAAVSSLRTAVPVHVLLLLRVPLLSGLVRIVAPANFDATLGVYRDNSGFLADATLMVANDDCQCACDARDLPVRGADPSLTYLSCVKVYVEAGVTYAVRVDGAGGSTGEVTVEIVGGVTQAATPSVRCPLSCVRQRGACFLAWCGYPLYPRFTAALPCDGCLVWRVAVWIVAAGTLPWSVYRPNPRCCGCLRGATPRGSV